MLWLVIILTVSTSQFNLIQSNASFSTSTRSLISQTPTTSNDIQPSRAMAQEPVVAKEQVKVHIDRTKIASISHFQPGISDVDTSLFTPWNGNNEHAVQKVQTLIRDGIAMVNEHIMGWGADDPWPDPNKMEPDNWETLDKKMQMVVTTGTTAVLTLCEAPWWMKCYLKNDGSTALLSRSDDFTAMAYSSRILDNKMDDWLHLVQRVAERYMVPPYNVRYFQVWNELKGYYNPHRNNLDIDDSAGAPEQAVATHGYTYMYNRVYRTLRWTAHTLGIDPTTIHIGGPYLVTNTWSAVQGQSNPSHFTRAYGNYDQRDLDALQYWLAHKIGAEFITLDGSNGKNRDGNITSDPFTAANKFADVVHWLRGLDERKYPGTRTLPVWWAEWYASPYTAITDTYNNAVKAYAMSRLIKAGGAVALAWGGTGEGTPAGGLWSTTHNNGGQPTRWYYTYKAFKDFFGPGTPLYRSTSSSSDIEVLATQQTVMLINKTSFTLAVSLNKQAVIYLTPYSVLVTDTENN